MRCPGSRKPVYIDYGGPGRVVPVCPECKTMVVVFSNYQTPDHEVPNGGGLLMGAPVLAADAAEVLPGWACLEISGSTLRLFGYVTETTIGGIPFLALLAPDSNGGLEARRLLNAQQIRWISPCSEDTARREARRQWTPR